MKTAIVVHGGAGSWLHSDVRLDQGIAVCSDAVKAGQKVLKERGSALDAVEVAVRLMEDSPVLDAGRGSFLTTARTIELDAMIMDGRIIEFGAVAAVQGILHPISLARRVMTNSPHNFLVGDGAELFANQIGFPRCRPEDLITEEQQRYYDENIKAFVEGKLLVADHARPMLTGTVGAVALDTFGNLAAATSTGGTRFKSPGRVGDSPLVGAGTYADNLTAAVSATGHGESLMRILISKRICDRIEQGMSPQDACDFGIKVLSDRVNGFGGAIAINTRGQIGIAFNTNAMPYAYITDEGEFVCGAIRN